MRKIFVILLLICGSCFVGAQELSLPSEPSDDCGFSLGVKGTLRMIPADSGKYQCSYLKIEPYGEVLKDTKDVFSEKPASGTIDFFFGIAQMGYDEKKKEERYAVVLILYSGCEDVISYKAEIMPKGKDRFVPTSVMDIFPGVPIREIWPYYIDMIHLQQFEKAGFEPVKKKAKNRKQRS